MECVTPHCAGTLRTGLTRGFCTLCRQPVSACTHCGGWNRPFALFCRQCGRAGTTWQTADPMDPDALRADPRRTVVPTQISTRPQVLAGFLWALSEGGDLYRLNPCANSGEQIEVHDRFWAEPQPHAFCVRRLQQPFGHAPRPAATSPAEDCAVIATSDRIVLSGLYSRQRRSLTPLPGETFLVNSRDEYGFVAAHGNSVYALSRYAAGISFCHLSLNNAEDRRLTVAHGDTAVCGPVLLETGDTEHLVLWSSSALWVYSLGNLTQIPVPEGVALPTAPAESALRLPPGHSPALANNGQLFLACTQFGRSALLRLTPAAAGWSTTLIAITDAGTLSETSTGQPLLSTPGRLLSCTGPAFRTLVQDPQIAARLPAWGQDSLTVFFCEADYGGLKQWLKAYAGTTEIPISWNLPTGGEVHACDGFWTTGTTLCTVCVLAERALRTEFLSWCV